MNRYALLLSLLWFCPIGAKTLYDIDLNSFRALNALKQNTEGALACPTDADSTKTKNLMAVRAYLQNPSIQEQWQKQASLYPQILVQDSLKRDSSSHIAKDKSTWCNSLFANLSGFNPTRPELYIKELVQEMAATASLDEALASHLKSYTVVDYAGNLSYKLPFSLRHNAHLYKDQSQMDMVYSDKERDQVSYIQILPSSKYKNFAATTTKTVMQDVIAGAHFDPRDVKKLEPSPFNANILHASVILSLASKSQANLLVIKGRTQFYVVYVITKTKKQTEEISEMIEKSLVLSAEEKP